MKIATKARRHKGTQRGFIIKSFHTDDELK